MKGDFVFHKIKIKDIFIVILLVLITMIGGYYYANVTARNTLWLKTYPIRAKIAERKLSCSHNSPLWLAKILTYQVNHGNAPANQIAYIDPKGTLHHCENGYVGEYPLIAQPINEKTRFRYASVTKLWTSDAILALIKQRKIDFNTKISSIITEIHQPKDPRINNITIGELLLHRGGFNRYSVFGNDMFGIGEPICPNHFDRLNHIQLGFSPNEKMSYSNLGYCLLGEVVSRLNQQSYTQTIKENYQFNGTTLAFIGNHPMPDEVSYNHIETDITGVGDIYTAFDYQDLASAAGLSGNAIDLAKQVKTMIEKPAPNILSLNKNLKCDITKLRDCYGYAMFPYQQAGRDFTVYFRDGGLLGLSSLVVVDSQGGVTALLSNGVTGNNEQGGDKVKMMIYDFLRQQH